MHRSIGMVVALTATLAAGVVAQGTNTLRLPLRPEKRLWIEGTSSVRKFTCQTTTFEATPTPAPTPASPIERAVQTVDVRVPVSTLSCGNGTMDGHLRKALRSEQNPEIRFELASYAVTAKTAAGTAVKTTGTMTIAGSSKTVEIDGLVTLAATGLRVQGAKQIRMSEYGVKPPSLMLGTLKVADDVTVHFDVVLER